MGFEKKKWGDGEIKCEVVTVLNEISWGAKESGLPTGKSQLRIVKWNGGKPVIERRTFRPGNEPNQWMTGKAQGFGLREMLIIKEKLEEIMEILTTDKQTDQNDPITLPFNDPNSIPF